MIKELINDLANSEIKLSTALTKCKIVRTELYDKTLEDFLQRELTGHNPDLVPSYRWVPSKPYLKILNKSTGKHQQVPLDLSQASKDLGEDITIRPIALSISEIENEISKSTNGMGSIYIYFSALQFETFVNHEHSLLNHYIFDSAYWSTPVSQFQNIHDRTKDALIGLLIAILEKHPEIDDKFYDMKNKKTTSSQKIEIGTIQSSVIGFGENVNQKENSISVNNIDGLKEKIIALGFEKTDADELETILTSHDKETISSKVLNWLGKMSSKAVEIGLEAKVPLLIEAVSNFS